MLKKKVTITKGLYVFTENPIILLYHFNNVSTNSWQFLKNEIKKLEDIRIVVIPNKICNTIVEKKQTNTEKELTFYNQSKIANLTFSSQKGCEHPLKHLFQGPTLVLACKTRDQLILIHNILKKSSNFIFVGGIYNNQNISHHCLEKLVKVNESVKLEFIHFLEYKKLSFFFLKNQFIIHCSTLIQILKKSLENKID